MKSPNTSVAEQTLDTSGTIRKEADAITDRVFDEEPPTTSNDIFKMIDLDFSFVHSGLSQGIQSSILHQEDGKTPQGTQGFSIVASERWTDSTSLEDNFRLSVREPLSIVYIGDSQQLVEPSDRVTVRDVTSLKQVLAPLQKSRIMAIDTETTGLDPSSDRVRLIQIAIPDHPVVIVDLFHLGQDLDPLRELLESHHQIILHNAKFDLKFLYHLGFKFNGMLFDTMLAEQLLTAGTKVKGYGLVDLARHYLEEALPKDEQTSDWSGELTIDQLQYAARDAEVLLRLHAILEHLLKSAKLEETANLEFAIIPTVMEMELNGMCLDRDQCDNLCRHLSIDKDKLEVILHKELGEINLNSPKQLLKAFRTKGLKFRSTKRTILDKYTERYPPIHDVIKYRKLVKLIQFAKKLPKHVHSETNRIHPEYRQIGAVTGRFSCANPNLQQIPRDKRFRSCFVAAPGHKLVIADYSQIELRVAAEISKDSNMIEAYQNGEDLHRLTASLITDKPMEEVTKEERQAAKAVNFGLMYAMNYHTLRDYAKSTYGVEMTREEAKYFYWRFFDGYPGLAAWHSEVYLSDQRETRTLSGRRRSWTNETVLAEVLNTPVQGSAADIMKKALSMLPQDLNGTNAKIIGSVHDEIILEVSEAQTDIVAKILKDTMEEAGRHFLKTVPVVADVNISDNWAGK